MSPAWGSLASIAAERWKPLTTMTILALALLAVGLAQTSGGQTVTGELGLAGAPQPFTELFFAHPASLPAVARPGLERQQVSFVIHNVEHRTMTYAWSVGTVAARSSVAGRTTIGAGGRVTISRDVLVACTPAERRSALRRWIQVSLAAPAESIGFWMACGG